MDELKGEVTPVSVDAGGSANQNPQSCRVWSWNEWDPLQEVIVGNPLNARYPYADKSTQVAEYPDRPLEEIPRGPFPQQIIEEAEEDLQEFIAALKKQGVTVKRPETWPHEKTFSTIFWETEGYYNYCPRDIVLVIGDQIIETPNVIRGRSQETFSYRSMLIDYMKSGAKWISAPKPMLLDLLFDVDLSKATPRNDEPAFDAANVLRFGHDLIYLVSGTGNEMGGHWLQSILGDKFRVHFLKDVYYGSHIDFDLCRSEARLDSPQSGTHQRRYPAENPQAVESDLQPTDGEYRPVQCRLSIQMHRQRLDRHECVQHQPGPRGGGPRSNSPHQTSGEAWT